MTAFGTVFTDEMIISWNDGNGWSAPEFVPSDSLNLHPAAHVLHYSSTCFEGLKPFVTDGSVRFFVWTKISTVLSKVPISFTCQLLMPR